jgi:hypothetical protein
MHIALFPSAALQLQPLKAAVKWPTQKLKSTLNMVCKTNAKDGIRASGYVWCPQGPPGGLAPPCKYLDARILFARIARTVTQMARKTEVGAVALVRQAVGELGERCRINGVMDWLQARHPERHFPKKSIQIVLKVVRRRLRESAAIR